MSAVVIDQFTRQAASFARLPSHEEATELLLDMAGIGAITLTYPVAIVAGTKAA